MCDDLVRPVQEIRFVESLRVLLRAFKRGLPKFAGVFSSHLRDYTTSVMLALQLLTVQLSSLP
jgi:hypothetical protein